MASLGDMKSSYPGITELTRQLDQEKVAMLSKRVEDLRSQNEELKVQKSSENSTTFSTSLSELLNPLMGFM